MRNIWALIVKEFIQIKRDRRVLGIILIGPLFLLILFGFALKLDVKNINLLVCDLDKTETSRLVTQKIQETGYFRVDYTTDLTLLDENIKKSNYRATLVIPNGFARDLNKIGSTEVQFFVDGSLPHVATAARNYLNITLNRFSYEHLTNEKKFPITIKSRTLYNPALKDELYFIPALIGLLITQITLLLTTTAIVREKESKTMDQLIVSPIKKHEIIIGKICPYIIISVIDLIFISGMGMLFFGITIRGSIELLLFCSCLYIFTCLSIGLLISTIAQTQQQAIFSSVFILIPSIILSGFIFPIDAMPEAIQYITKILPLTYYNNILRGIFVKGIGIEYLYKDMIILTTMGIILLGFSVKRFKKYIA